MAEQMITATEFATYRNISKKIDTSKVNECIKLAQNIDLFDVLGDFYFDLIVNLSASTYQDLLSGSTFQIDGKNLIHEGLDSLLADYTYARYIYLINTNHTPFGLQSKYTDDSNPVDRNMVKDIVKQTQMDADIKFQLIDKYLRQNSTTFSRYSSGDNSGINTFNQRFSIL